MSAEVISARKEHGISTCAILLHLDRESAENTGRDAGHKLKHQRDTYVFEAE
jgi:hypothetical protein